MNIHNEIKELLDVIDKHREASLTGDPDKLIEYLHKDFRHVNSKGLVRNLDEHLELYRSSVISIQEMLFSEVEIKLFAKTAITTIRSDVKEKFNQEDRSGCYRLSRIYVKENSKWLCVHNHGHKIGE